ncbi:YkgJ family cysteine cluster protein [Jannaschia aquimarina]|uniref:Flagellin N-methylase n=1 Tax=Jannaschia aquimarina TaxID=935700 RepID=A0A0D1DDF4_9RHOB|nr:YkgJ family cysteine cluster protein [Jannaschia aquimarina]KIT18023.1 Flagellin N-methylase [Jannaschia aquimarina]SNS88733.1 Putative zinc- or iron-chelating domain-containing protein [Jannaschia aquimarina]
MGKTTRSARKPVADRAALRAALAAARLPGSPAETTQRARAGLLAWLDAQPDRPVADLTRDLSRGLAALAIGRTMLAQIPMPPGLACASGCAFCCILTGADGGTITAHEARALHEALADRSGPDGDAWHPKACPALDPETRTCRAYEARPMICRSYVSPDASACQEIAQGRAAPGPLTHPAQLAYLTAHALVRAALGGGAPTYSLRATAAARDEDALAAARHVPKALDAERRRLARAASR